MQRNKPVYSKALLRRGSAVILATELSQGKPVAGIGAAAADGM